MTRLGLVLWFLAAGGCMYTDVMVPLDQDLDETQLGSKVGRATLHSCLGLFAWGDAGIQAAAQDGGITVLRHADRQVFVLFLGLYYRHTTVVYGD